MTTSKSGLKVPTVHINGSSKEALLKQTMDARIAGREFMSKLQEMAPNGRDFYVDADDGALLKARDQHNERMRALQVVLTNIDIIYAGILSQGK